MNEVERSATAYIGALGDIGGRIEAARNARVALSFNEAIEESIVTLRAATEAGRRVYFVGNGGSAAIASHMATDYMKNGGMRALAFNDASSLTCLGNDLGYPHIFEKPIERFSEAGDVLIAISSSGRSENIRRAAAAAVRRGCFVITLSGFGADNPLRLDGQLNFYVPSSEYGQVEILHLVICHCILDNYIARQSRPSVTGGHADV